MGVGMTDATVEDAPVERQQIHIQVDIPLVACVVGAMLMLAAFVSEAPIAQLEIFSDANRRAFARVAFALALVLPVIACWRRAIRDNQLPAKNGLEPVYEHVSGWSAVFLLAVVAIIAYVVWWAAQSDDANRKIHSLWGLWIVCGLTAAFITVASAPLLPRLVRSLRLEKATTALSAVLNAPIEWIGRALSVVDSMLVFAVANAAGTNRKHVMVRYGLLLSVIGSCAALGYLWPPPLAFIPLGWGFLVAFAVSRRWAWIEEDRELAMLNSTLSQAHIRVGFAQNLRDEALVAFLSMFLLVPLALRQAQILADDNDVRLFDVAADADIDSLVTWISFYGTELAKAVPFVDWAEIYHVEGDAPLRAETDLGQHAVFLTRVLIDLVFLAALLQAISSASRDTQQRDLFYRKQSIHRLDPFTEPDAFRSLVRKRAGGGWEASERFEDFPRRYDPNRLVELSSHSDERIAEAARLLLARDDVQGDPHYQLSARANEREVTPEEIEGLLNTIENGGPERNVYQLALARRRLLSRAKMREVRQRLVTMITQAPRSAERTDRLIEAMVGESREAYQRARGTALEALAPEIGINLRIKYAIQQVADHDGAQALRKKAQEVLSSYRETPD